MSEVERAQRLIDLEGVARRLGVNLQHVRRLVAERQVPFVKRGHLMRFDPAAIDEWLDEQRHGVEPA